MDFIFVFKKIKTCIVDVISADDSAILQEPQFRAQALSQLISNIIGHSWQSISQRPLDKCQLDINLTNSVGSIYN